jgi:very-short-patch-repair endonuclease
MRAISKIGALMVSEHREFARSLRNHSTRAEDLLWERLRGSRFHGMKFRRQVPFDRFVVDFYCHAAKLAIEGDGKQHGWFDEYDAERTATIERLGIRVVRFTNAEVCNDIDSVLAKIRAELRLSFNRGATPLLEGEGQG